MKTPEFVCRKNGPYVVKGLQNLQNGANGETLEVKEVTTLCRCGGSKNKPFCDGTHWTVDFDENAKSEG